MMLYRINVNVADVRAEPDQSSERTSQVLFNEPVEVIDKGKHFSEVKLGDGYRGFVRNEFISSDEEPPGEKFVVSAMIAMAYTAPDESSLTATILPFTATVSPIRRENNFVICKSCRYGDIYISGDDLVKAGETPRLNRRALPLLVESAKRFIGVPYLWGGKSFFGMDCSGFVQVNLRFFGIDMPRDTKDQINIGRNIARKEISAGDLLFFKRHVALAVSEKQFIHSSQSRGGVGINSLHSGDANYLKKLDSGLVAVKRIVED